MKEPCGSHILDLSPAPETEIARIRTNVIPFRRGTARITPATLTFALVVSLLAGCAILLIAASWRVGPIALIGDRVTPSMSNHTETLARRDVSVVDGDTIRANGRTVRLVGVDTPEMGPNARCARERELGARANARLRELIAGGGLELQHVRCACRPGTEGTSECNYGRACGVLKTKGRDVGVILINEGLARPYVCGTQSCPPRAGWCDNQRGVFR
jgi:endonuclease YncB( thermonuclease family)